MGYIYGIDLADLCSNTPKDGNNKHIIYVYENSYINNITAIDETFVSN